MVYGADFDDKLHVRHCKAVTIEELQRQRGSKYVQSDLSGILKAVRTDLKAGIDLVCHGVPSPLIFLEHLKYVEKTSGKQIVDYKFRGKERSGWRAYIKYIFKDKTVEKRFLGNDFYAYSFYRSRFNRRSCFSCGFSHAKRVGDITLSDFWNAESNGNMGLI